MEDQSHRDQGVEHSTTTMQVDLDFTDVPEVVRLGTESVLRSAGWETEERVTQASHWLICRMHSSAQRSTLGRAKMTDTLDIDYVHFLAQGQSVIDCSADIVVMLGAIKAAALGILVTPAGAAHRLSDHHPTHPADDVLYERLSRRERQVLSLVAEGLTHSQIGRRVSLSASTISTYVVRIKEKCGARSTAELTRLAIAVGISKAGVEQKQLAVSDQRVPAIEP